MERFFNKGTNIPCNEVFSNTKKKSLECLTCRVMPLSKAFAQDKEKG